MKKLKDKEFVCEPDARRAAERWFTDHPFLRVDGILITTSWKKTDKKNVVVKVKRTLLKPFFHSILR